MAYDEDQLDVTDYVNFITSTMLIVGFNLLGFCFLWALNWAWSNGVNMSCIGVKRFLFQSTINLIVLGFYIRSLSSRQIMDTIKLIKKIFKVS